jgi:hypothetical protein
MLAGSGLDHGCVAINDAHGRKNPVAVRLDNFAVDDHFFQNHVRLLNVEHDLQTTQALANGSGIAENQTHVELALLVAPVQKTIVLGHVAVNKTTRFRTYHALKVAVKRLDDKMNKLQQAQFVLCANNEMRTECKPQRHKNARIQNLSVVDPHNKVKRCVLAVHQLDPLMLHERALHSS